MEKIAVFAPGGLHALLSQIIQIKKTVDGNTSAVSELGSEFAVFTELITEELHGKRDKAQFGSCILPAADWVPDGVIGYPYRLDVPVEGVTDRARADVILEPASQDTALKCALCPSCETLDGFIRFWAVSIPTADIAVEYWIERGGE